MWVRKCLPLKIGFQPLSCSLGTILYEWQCFVVQGLGGKFIIFVLMVISCMHYCAMRPKIASRSLHCPFGVMRDGPHVGKVRSRDPPGIPWCWFLLFPLTQKSLEVWTIPSTISSTFIVPVEQKCSFQSTQSQSCPSHHPNQDEYNRPPTNPMNIDRDCRSRNAPLTFLPSMCKNKNGPF